MNINALKPRATEMAALMKAIANPYRLLTVCKPRQREHSAGALVTAIGLSQTALAQHLAKLRRGRIVQTRPEGQTIHYSRASAKVAEVIALLYHHYCAPDRGAASTKETSDVA